MDYVNKYKKVVVFEHTATERSTVVGEKFWTYRNEKKTKFSSEFRQGQNFSPYRSAWRQPPYRSAWRQPTYRSAWRQPPYRSAWRHDCVSGVLKNIRWRLYKYIRRWYKK